jgi:hypothetical protein
MTKDGRRKQLASLSFAEKLKILEMLRDRSLAIANSRKKIKPEDSPQHLPGWAAETKN